MGFSFGVVPASLAHGLPDTFQDLLAGLPADCQNQHPPHFAIFTSEEGDQIRRGHQPMLSIEARTQDILPLRWALASKNYRGPDSGQ